MRVLWLSHFVPAPPIGGVRQRSHHLLRQAAARHEVHVVTLNQGAFCPTPAHVEEAVAMLRPLVSGIDVFPIPNDRRSWRWLPMTLGGVLRSTPYDVNWLRSGAVARHLRDLVARESFDCVHVDTIGLVQYLPALRDVPVVLNHHNVESQMAFRRAEREPGWMAKRYLAGDAAKLARLERSVCPRAAVNLVVSELDAERLREVAPDARTAVVANGVDVDYFRRSGGIEPDPRHLVFAGGMGWYPNREAMLWFVREIWPALVADDPTYRATIIGRGAPPEVRTAAADARIEVPGFVDDVRPYIERAGIYVCPIRDGGGTRLKILDALAMGIPLVATGLAVEGLAMSEDVHFLRAETPEQYVAQIRRLCADPELRAQLGSAGRAHVERRFSWDAIGNALDAAYTSARTPHTLPAPRPSPTYELASR
jgi:sugar transferase (PEP-CTERM/EpsH1 system associated)